MSVIQTALLYHNALSKEEVEVSDVLSYVRKTKAKNELTALKTQIASQEKKITELLALRNENQQPFVGIDKKKDSEVNEKTTLLTKSSDGTNSNNFAPYGAVKVQPPVVQESTNNPPSLLKPILKDTSASNLKQTTPATSPRYAGLISPVAKKLSPNVSTQDTNRMMESYNYGKQPNVESSSTATSTLVPAPSILTTNSPAKRRKKRVVKPGIAEPPATDDDVGLEI